MPVPIVPRPTTATVLSGDAESDREGSDRGVAIAGLQERVTTEGRTRIRQRAHTVRRLRVMPGYEAHTPGAVSG